ncbi:toll/interleukin-1 receptor domain-containing protein [Curtobacterium flaccumfaciens]|uniref:toll/interleukin-1 receptor domain-containing protein n=1 Tax=Curtobacterium flaccumfaciens TaxID=2035 RepID=UPI0034292746
MVTGDPKHVFISYVKEDTPAVEALCRVLDRAGVPYWRDRRALAPGDAWKTKIRDAIRSESLVFLACFSTTSVAKPKSYMNEELTLATEEFRMRPPGATWLIPARLDEVEIPDWDLGGGRTLGDLNYTSLFGEDYAAEAAALVMRMSSVLGITGTSAAQSAEAVAGAAAEQRPLLMRRATKEMLHDSSKRIELDDLVLQETRRIVSAINDPSVMPLSTTGATEREQIQLLVRRADDLVALVEPLCWSVQVAARWSNSDGFTAWGSALRTLTAEAAALASGRSNLIALRSLPALCLFTTAAIAAHAAGRWDVLRDLTTLQIDASNGRPDALLNVLGPWTPFDNSDFLPNLLSRRIGTDQDSAALATGIGNGSIPRKYTPVSDWLLELLRPVLSEQFATGSEYERGFNDAELFLGVLSQDLISHSDSTWRQNSAWLGRYTWIDRHSRQDVVDELESVIRSAGEAWPPLQVGLFGGDLDRALEAVADFSVDFKEPQRRRL